MKKLPQNVRNSRTFNSKQTTLFFHLLLFLFVSTYSFGQGPGSLFVDAGPDMNIDCGSGGCTDITATFLETFETFSATYTVDSVPYTPPFAFDGLANPLNPNIDDAWSGVDTLPFDFCYFGNLEQEFQVGSNGVIRFEVDPTDTSNGWSFTEDLPNNSNPTLGEANIFTPGHDIDPSASSTEEIGYEVLGEYPNRVLVVSYYEVPLFSGACNALLATHMVVLYEFSNVVEVYIQDKPTCPTWNDGNATLGIQNNAGDVAYVPPGRNTSDSPWTTNNEAWRFSPSGVETYVFEWLDASGTVIGTTPTINVCPQNGGEIYTARVTYTNACNGDVVVLTDEVEVTTTTTFSLDLGGDQEFCDQSSYDITATISGSTGSATYLWNTGATTQTITVTESGTYSVDVTIDGCTLSDSVTIQLDESPIIELGPDIETCFEEIVSLDASPSNYDPADCTYVWSLDGTVIAGAVDPIIAITQIGTYSVVVTFGNCSSEDSVTVTTFDLQVDLGADIETCFDEDVVLDASPSNYDPNAASYVWSLNGNVLSSETLPTLMVIESGTYSVVVNGGTCSGSDSITISGRDDLEVILGDDFRSCPNEELLITAVTDEEGVTYQWSLNGDVITDATDATLNFEIESGTMGTQTYTVEITKGDCTGTDSLDVTLYDNENCVVTEGISPNSDGVNDCLDVEFLGDRSGSFSIEIFNRFGTSVFALDNYVNEWCGQTDDGDELPTGTYFYVMKFETPDAVFGDVKSGWIYLNRDSN
jgi:gliding motility-associated-like protein